MFKLQRAKQDNQARAKSALGPPKLRRPLILALGGWGEFMEHWYFETSAVNWFMHDRTINDAIATKQLQTEKGRSWRLSTVTLWEILSTSNPERRDEIIHFSQHLFDREILPSPSELIVEYIKNGMPTHETPGQKYISTSEIARVWRDLVDDKGRCFNVDHASLVYKQKLFQSTTKDIHKIINNGDVLIKSSDPTSGMDTTLSSLLAEIPFIKEGEFVSEEERVLYKVSLYYIIFILVSEGDWDNTPVKSYWKSLGVDKTCCRIRYVLDNLYTLVHRGPFIVMAYMTVAQSKGKYSRGAWNDSLHAMYLPYVDFVFTSDAHFDGLKDLMDHPLVGGKIQYLPEIDVKTYEKSLIVDSAT